MYHILITVEVKETHGNKEDSPVDTLAENLLAVHGGTLSTLYAGAGGETLEKLVRATLYEAERTKDSRENKEK